MKNAIMILLILATGTFWSCNKVKSLANISVNIPYDQQVQIPRINGDTGNFPLPPGGMGVSLPALPVQTNAQSYLDQYHTSGKNVINVSLKSLALDILSPATQNFDFLDSVQMFISAPGQPEVLVAYDYNVPKGQTTLTLNSNNTNLKDYFLSDTMYFRMYMHINAFPASGTNLDIRSVFNLVANPLE